jgi:hypothetical protein
MRGDPLTRPVRAALPGSSVTHGEYEIQRRAMGSRQFVPTLTPQTLAGKSELLQHIERERMHVTLGVTAGTQSEELAPAYFVDDGFAENAAYRVTGTQKENAVDLVRHD